MPVEKLMSPLSGSNNAGHVTAERNKICSKEVCCVYYCPPECACLASYSSR